jgi:hypothetical protein
MIGQTSKTGRPVGIFLLGCVLFSNPFLTLFNYKILVLGVPLLFFYIFAAWLLLIMLIIGVAKTSPKSVLSRAPTNIEDPDAP